MTVRLYAVRTKSEPPHWALGFRGMCDQRRRKSVCIVCTVLALRFSLTRILANLDLDPQTSGIKVLSDALFCGFIFQSVCGVKGNNYQYLGNSNKQIVADDVQKLILFFRESMNCQIHVKCLLGIKCQPLFSLKIKKYFKVSSAVVAISALRINRLLKDPS